MTRGGPGAPVLDGRQPVADEGGARSWPASWGIPAEGPAAARYQIGRYR